MRTRALAALSGIVLVGGLVAVPVTTAQAASGPGKARAVDTVSLKKAFKVTWKSAKPKGEKVDRYAVATRQKAKRGWSSWDTKNVGPKKRSVKVKAKNGTRHQVRVRAHNADGWGKWSKKKNVRVGQPAQVKKVTATGGIDALQVSWKKAKKHAAKIKNYRLAVRPAGQKKWDVSKVKAKKRTKVVKNLASGKQHSVRVRAVNKFGAGPWSKVATATPRAAVNPRLTVDTPGPYQPGDVVTASFSGFPHDHPIINVAICANDGRPLSGPNDCATLNGASNKLVDAKNGAGSAKLTIPSGALGNTNKPIDCTAKDGNCAIVAATIGGDFYMAGPIRIDYVNARMTVSNEGPYSGGESVNVSFAGFPGDHGQINVAVCRMDIQPGGPDDCATLMGPSNKIVDAKGGAGSTSLTIPTSIEVGPAASRVTLDCTTGTSCGIIATTITSEFFMAGPHMLAFNPV